jgi:RimJ/RimL family protein N-acetyltransferase
MFLGTDRLTLRPLQSTDVEAVASYSMKPEFIRFLPLPPQTLSARRVGQPEPSRRDQRAGCRGFRRTRAEVSVTGSP